MPAPTWGWLKMNDTSIEIPAGLELAGAVEIEAAEHALGMPGDFEAAVAEMQASLDHARAARGDQTAANGSATAVGAAVGAVPAIDGADADEVAPGATPGAASLDAAAAERPCVRAVKRLAAPQTGAGALSDLDTPALSSYQLTATRQEIADDIAAAFETGIGADARSYLNFAAGEPAVVSIAAGKTERATVRVSAEAGDAAAASIDVVAGQGSALDLMIALDATEGMDVCSHPAPADGSRPSASEGAGNATANADVIADAGSAADTSGATGAETAVRAGGQTDARANLLGSELRVFAGAGSHVNVTVFVTGSPSSTVLDDSGYILDQDARVNVRHIVLGGAHVATGLAADLRGDRSRIDIDTRYLASGNETRDFNYIVRQRGRKTVSNMDANGVLAGSSSKCLRGTIDLVHGCSGSEGTERETVLIADERVKNKTVPVILCDEDDVAGNHGATIGHIRPDQLFYLESRGISSADAEALFMRAKLEDAAFTAPDDRVRTAVCRLGNTLVGTFEEELA